MESVVSNILTITDKALAKLQELNQKNQVLRVAVVGGGCSGLSYKLTFVDKPEEKDTIIQVPNLSIVIDPKSALFIRGMQLDFTDGLNGSGFVFNNPLAAKSCGCGSSFAL